jgi:hypothetical protein
VVCSSSVASLSVVFITVLCVQDYILNGVRIIIEVEFVAFMSAVHVAFKMFKNLTRKKIWR